MPDLDAISDQTYATAGADFAFVLTRRGRLISRHAPQEMPQEGRSRVVEAALSLAEGARFGHLELPREDLVPYGGAAPVDVYFGVAAEMLLCVVMPSWAAKEGVLPALESGVRALDELGHEEARPARKRRSAVAGLASLAAGPPIRSRARPAAGPAEVAPPANPPPASPAPPPKPPLPRRPAPLDVSLLEIRIGEAQLGRESLAAIEREMGVARPSLPDVRVGVAAVGRETLVAIDADLREQARPGSAPDAVRVDLVSISRESLADIAAAESRQATAGPRPSMPLIRADRVTQPYVESAESAKRTAEAAKRGRKVAAPELTVEVVDPDSEVFEAAVTDRERSRRGAP